MIVSCKLLIFWSFLRLITRSVSDNLVQDRIIGKSYHFKITYYIQRITVYYLNLTTRALPRLNIINCLERLVILFKWYCFRKELREIKDSGETKILLDCSFNILSSVLFQAQQVGLMGSEHNFIITSLVCRMICTKQANQL